MAEASPTPIRYGGHVRANGIRQHYLRYAGTEDLPPLVVIPGITSPAATWGFVGEKLEAFFDTYILDVRGRGLTEANESVDYSLDSCAADVVAFADAQGFHRYFLAGHSMGGRIAIRAARSDNRVEKLVLIDPPLSGPGRPPYGASLDRYIEAIALMKRGEPFSALRRFNPSWSDEHLRLRAEWLPTCDERAVREAHRGFQEDDIHGDLPHLGMPTLLMVAGKGLLTSESVAEFSRLAPGITVRTIADAGHMIPMDDWNAFFAALSEFIGIGPVRPATGTTRRTQQHQGRNDR